MLSNNGLIVGKKLNMAFIDKLMMLAVACLLILVFTPIVILWTIYFSELPLIIKIGFPIILGTTIFSIIFVFFCGLTIKNNGKIIFVDMFRIKKYNLSDFNEMAIIFNECENKKYSVLIQFKLKTGKIFEKDYANAFRNRKHKNLSMAINTIQYRKVEQICKELKETNIDIFYLAIIDKNGKLEQIC